MTRSTALPVLALLFVASSIVPAPRGAPVPSPALTTVPLSEPYPSPAAAALNSAPQPIVQDGFGNQPASAILGGFATWYRDASQPAGGLYAAAGPALRAALGDWRGAVVRVQAGRRWTSVVLRDACWCRDRHGRPTLLDVSPAAIAQLEPAWQRLGVVEVRVAWTVLPATDSLEGSR